METHPKLISSGYQLFMAHVECLWGYRYLDQEDRRHKIISEWLVLPLDQKKKWAKCVGGLGVPPWYPHYGYGQLYSQPLYIHKNSSKYGLKALWSSC